jgi:hypothetical protein
VGRCFRGGGEEPPATVYAVTLPRLRRDGARRRLRRKGPRPA